MPLQAPPLDTLQQYLPYVIDAVQRFLGALLDASPQGGLPNVVWTSWWRSAAHNLEVGGAPGSQHLKGLAFDVSGPDMFSVADAWRARGGTVVDESATKNHMHLQLFPYGQAPT